jgi:hypothetical protein
MPVPDCPIKSQRAYEQSANELFPNDYNGSANYSAASAWTDQVKVGKSSNNPEINLRITSAQRNLEQVM